MPLITLQQKDLTELAQTYGKVYDTKIGQVSYTKLVNPEGFVLLSKDDQLRFYLYKKPDGIWEHIWGASSIVHDGLPTSESLIQWRLTHALRAGKQGLDESSALSAQILEESASEGTKVHKAAEDLLNGKEVVLAGRTRKQTWAIGSFANFLTEHEIRNPLTERIVVYDQMVDCSHEGGYVPHDKQSACDGTRIVYGGTIDLIVEIFNKVTKKWERWLIDYKTSSDVHLSHKIQAIGYKAAAELSLGIKIDRVGIMLLGKNTQKGYLLSPVGEERGHRITFRDFLLTYNMLLLVNNGKLPGPSYKTFPKSIKIDKEALYVRVDTNDNTISDPAVGIPSVQKRVKAGETAT